LADSEIIVLIARLGIDQSDAHELLGMLKRKTSQHDRVDNGELRGGAADAEAEHEHGQKAKRFVLPQNAKADSNILTK
jgi:hypothetical protein